MSAETLQAPLRVAYIGCGTYAQNLARAGRTSPLVEPTACGDINPQAARLFADTHGVTPAKIDAILADPSIEAVIIATPNHAHRDNAVAAACAGKHVFVEKPIANELADALEIIGACQKNGVVLAVGHNARFHPGHRRMREIINAGEIGIPLGAEANFSHDGGLKIKPDEWRFSRETCPALPLMQLGVHFVETIQYFLGPADEVFSYAQRSVIDAENDDSMVSLIRLKSGPLAYVGSYYACPRTYYVAVHGTEGSVYCDRGVQLALRRIGEKDYSPVSTEEADTQLAEIEDFARSIRNGCKPEVDGETALEALAVVRAAIESAALGRPVRVDEMLQPYPHEVVVPVEN